MKKKCYLNFLIFLFFTFSFLCEAILTAKNVSLNLCQNPDPIVVTAVENEIKKSELSNIKVTQLTLKNGMTVLLKPTDFETDEIFFKLSALGGFGLLNPEERFSGEFSVPIAWESGMGGLTSDQISVLLYEHSLEFESKIEAFSRSIEGNSGKEGLEMFLKCVHMLFTQQQFSQTGWEAARISASNNLKRAAVDCDLIYETALIQTNTQELQSLKPMVAEDLEKIDFEKAKTIFYRYFSDPSEFVCVIVGSFDIHKAENYVNRYLGEIPIKINKLIFEQNVSASFPQGIIYREISIPHRQDSLTRLTFPLKILLDEKSIDELSFACQVIEARLRRMITKQLDISYGIDVSYEFPLFPYLENPWISIKFRCIPKLCEVIKQIILRELRDFQLHGATGNEIEEIKKLEAGSDEFWLRDNFYWMSILTNYYLWKWDPEHILKDNSEKNNISLEKINHLLKSAFSLNNFSVVTAKPS